MKALGMKIVLAFLLSTSLIGYASKGFAEEITFYLEDDGVYASRSTTDPGFLLEVVLRMSKDMGIKHKVMFLPWKRAQVMAINTPNSIIFPLTRTDERETQYRWVAPIFDVPVMFITKEGSPVINSVEDAKKLTKIAVLIGTPQENFIDEQGFTRVAKVNANKLFEALATNKVDAIYTAGPEAIIGWKNGGHGGKLQMGKTIQTLPLWIATSKKSTDIDIDKWKAALNQTMESGFFDKTFNKYYFDKKATKYFEQ